MADRPPLTPRQSRILEVIRDSVRDRGYPPTLRELTAAVGISSSSTASEQLRLLQARGYIRLSPNTPRGIMLLDPTGPTLEQSGHVLLLDRNHRDDRIRYTCPGCGTEDLQRVALVDLAYVFDVCTCRRDRTAQWDHLVEQLWHRSCLTTSGTS